MDEHEFDSLRDWQPFRPETLGRFEAQAGRVTGLAVALWGNTPADLQRQLTGRYPKLPKSVDLADLHKLLAYAHRFEMLLEKNGSLWPLLRGAQATQIEVGGRLFNIWQARTEVVRRAIEFLEKGG